MRKFGFLALLLILCMGGAALAQDTMPVFCGDLSQADCTILTNSQTATKTLDSASFDLTINTTVTNAPNMTGPMTFGITGNGSYSGAAALHSSDMMTTMQTDPGAFFTNVLDKFDGDLTLTINLPPEATQADASIPSSITLQLRLVDGIGYINFDTLQPLLAQMGSGMNLKGWGGLDLASLLKAALQQMPDMFKNMNGGADMSATMQQFRDPNFMKQFATIKRTDTGTGDTATFETTVDLGKLMALPQMQDMMRQRMQAQGQTMTQEEMDRAMAMSSQMFQNMTITIDQVIGLSDSFIHSIHGTVNFDTSAMMASMSSMDSTPGMTPTPAAAATEQAPVINVDFTINYSNFNSAPAITAPTNVTMLPWQTLLGMESNATAEATMEMTGTGTPTETQIPPKTGPTQEMTSEPTSEMTAEPTTEMTTEPTAVGTVEPTVEVTAGS